MTGWASAAKAAIGNPSCVALPLNPASLCVCLLPVRNNFAPVVTIVVMLVTIAAVAEHLEITLEVSEVRMLGAWLYMIYMDALSSDEGAAAIASLISLPPRANYIIPNSGPIPISTKFGAETWIV